MLIRFLLNEGGKCTTSENHATKIHDGVNSEQSSLKSHLLWVTMLIIFQKLGNCKAIADATYSNVPEPAIKTYGLIRLWSN